MNSTLSQEQKDELRHSFLQPGFTIDSAVRKVMSWGYDENTAKQLIIAEFQAFKKDYFHQKVKKEENGKTTEALFIALAMLSMAGPLFGIQSPLWHIVVVIISGIAGYYMFKSRPIAGIVGAITYAIVFPLAYHFYFSGRRSFINIEVLIPMLIAVAPAAIMYFLISFTVYGNREDN